MSCWALEAWLRAVERARHCWQDQSAPRLAPTIDTSNTTCFIVCKSAVFALSY